MKFSKNNVYIKICLILILTLNLNYSIKLSRGSTNLETSWNRLFTDLNNKIITFKNKSKMPSTINKNTPQKKTNIYEQKMIGWGLSAYLFDYLDDVLLIEVISEFTKIFNLAKSIQADPKFIEPYTLEKMTNTEEKLSGEELLAKLNQFTKTRIDVKIWENSITVAQIDKIINEWNWHSENVNHPAKNLVDKFDYNGDGRLSTKEFIIAMIVNNKSKLDICKNCMEGTIANTIDPIFMYLDSTSNEKVTAEEIWKNLKKLRRSNPNAYNLYKCDYMGGEYRTSAVNDFVIKSKGLVKSTQGYLNKSEFRMGILIGYWMRQVDDKNIFDNSVHNMKNIRWGDEGSIDKQCEKLKE